MIASETGRVVDLEIGSAYLALLVQGHASLDGAAGNLDPDAFPQQLRPIVVLIREAFDEYHEVPSFDTLQSFLRNRPHKPAYQDLILKSLQELRDRSIPDPRIIAETFTKQAHYCDVQRDILRAAQMADEAERQGVLVDRQELAGLIAGEAEATPEAEPSQKATPSPVLDVKRLCELVPYFGDVLKAFTPTTDAPLEFLLGTGLVALAGTMGKRFRLSVGTDTLFPNLWVMQIAPSSLRRKTTAQLITHKLCHLTEGHWILPRAGSPEGFIQALGDGGGAGVQIIAEFGAWLRAMERNYMAGHKEVMCELYDSIPAFKAQRTKKKAAGEKEKTPDVDVILWPCLSISTATTRAWLNRNLDESDLYSGFLARFIYLIAGEPRAKLLATRRQPPEPEALARVVNTLRTIASVAEVAPSTDSQPAGKEMRIRADAQVVYEKWARSYPRPLLEAAPFCERLETTVLKVAMICSVAQGSHDWISPKHMEAAVLLGDYFRQAINFVLGEELALGKTAQTKQKVYDLIRAAGKDGLQRKHLLVRAGMYARDLDLVVTTLEEEGRITIHERQNPRGMSGRGRKATRYVATTEEVQHDATEE